MIIPAFRTLVVIFLFSSALNAQSDTVSLIFAGDIMGHLPQIKSAEVIPNKKYNYEPCFRYIKPVLESADIAIGNLELTLPGQPPYQGYPMFRSPDQLAADLKQAGFDILVTANNHSNDSRGQGVKHTIEVLRREGFLHTGTFRNQKERDAFYPLMIYKKNFKIALLNYTYDTNGVPTEAPTVVNLIDTVQIAADLAEARARKPHYIIVVMHWGIEYQLKENATQRQLARFLIRNGADMIIGAHPHVVQPVRVERAPGPDGKPKDVLVVYSLGNFISNQVKPHTDGGILYQVELVKTNGMAGVTLNRHGYVPVYRYIHKPAGAKSTYYTLPISILERRPATFLDFSTAAKTTMAKFAASVRTRLGDREWIP